MSEYTPTTDEVREDFAFPWSPEQIGDRPARVAAFDRWLAAHDAEVRAEAESDPAKDERLARYIAMATPLGYQSALTVVQQMTLMIQAENEARRAGVVAEEPEGRSLTPDEINALPIGAVVMTESDPERFGVYEQRVWQKFGGQPDWQFGVPRHEWQCTDGGFERVGNADRHRGQFGANRRVTLLWVPVKQEGAER